MFFSRYSRPGDPAVLDDPRPETREFKSNTGNAGLDGYSVLSAADRETGHREPIGSKPRGFNVRSLFED